MKYKTVGDVKVPDKKQMPVKIWSLEFQLINGLRLKYYKKLIKDQNGENKNEKKSGHGSSFKVDNNIFINL